MKLIGDEEDRPREDLLADTDSELPEQATSRQLLTEAVAYLLGMLPPREAAILQLRYGLKMAKATAWRRLARLWAQPRADPAVAARGPGKTAQAQS